MQSQKHLFIALTLSILAIASARDFKFTALTLTNVGEVGSIRPDDVIECKITGIERNVTVKLDNGQINEKYDTKFSRLYNYTLHEDCLKFSVYKYEESPYLWSKFRIINAHNNASYYFIVAENAIQIYRLNASNQIEWDTFIEIDQILTMRNESEFMLKYYNDVLIFGHKTRGIIAILPLRSIAPGPHVFQIEGMHTAPALWNLKSCEDKTQTLNFDKLTTFCWNSTQHNDTGNTNQTETDFTMLVDAQYRLSERMETDLRDFNKWDESKMIRALIEEFVADVKENYSNTRRLHRTILMSHNLSASELKLKEKYVKKSVFDAIRLNYFTLYKNAQLILSRFR